MRNPSRPPENSWAAAPRPSATRAPPSPLVPCCFSSSSMPIFISNSALLSLSISISTSILWLSFSRSSTSSFNSRMISEGRIPSSPASMPPENISSYFFMSASFSFATSPVTASDDMAVFLAFTKAALRPSIFFFKLSADPVSMRRRLNSFINTSRSRSNFLLTPFSFSTCLASFIILSFIFSSALASRSLFISSFSFLAASSPARFARRAISTSLFCTSTSPSVFLMTSLSFFSSPWLMVIRFLILSVTRTFSSSDLRNSTVFILSCSLTNCRFSMFFIN